MSLRIFVLAIFVSLSVNLIKAQTFEVAEIKFENDPLVEDFFQKQGKIVQWKGLAKTQYEEQIKSMIFSIEIKKDTAFIKPAHQKGSRVFKLVKIEPNGYQLSRSRDFWRLVVKGGNPQLITGRYVPLSPPEEDSGEAFTKLKDKYGEKAEAFISVTSLKEIDQSALENALDVEKAFKVTDVSLEINNDVIAFGQENREFFIPYTDGSQSMVEKTYLNQEFKVDIEYKKISISSQNSENSSFSFSSSLQPVKDGVYRASVGKAHWDFYVNETSEEPFDLQKVKYFEYLELKDEDKAAESYDELKEKYGNKLPYNVIVQQVDEVPVVD